MLSVDEALQNILREVEPLPPERIGLGEALHRILAEDVLSGRLLPPFDNSQMDGYAVRAADLRGASDESPIALEVTSRIFAGDRPTRRVGPGEAARIMTGAPMPPGADAVVMQERTTVDGDRVSIAHAPNAGEFVRPAGEDCRPGDRVLAAGTVLTPGHIALLAALGRSELSVFQRPRVGILSTGDELCRIDEAPDGRIVDSNAWGLMAQVLAAGAIPVRLGVARDDRAEIDRLLAAASGCDVVLTSGGVSVGEKDFVLEALEALGVELRFWKVAMRPGKPLAFGVQGSRLFFGLPGNPVSSMVTFELFVRAALRVRMGHPQPVRPALRARLAEPVRKPAGLTHFLRAITTVEEGRLISRPLGKQSSGLVSAMATANSLMVLREQVTELAAGEEVEVLPFDGSLG